MIDQFSTLLVRRDLLVSEGNLISSCNLPLAAAYSQLDIVTIDEPRHLISVLDSNNLVDEKIVKLLGERPEIVKTNLRWIREAHK